MPAPGSGCIRTRGPAVPLSASELARCFSDLWVSKGAVREDFQRTVNGHVSHIELFYGKRDYLIRARYRRVGQPGRATPAVIRADAPDPRAALEAVVGPVDWFEVDLVAEPVPEPVPEQEVDAIVEAEPVNGHVFPIDAAPAEPAANRVVPLRLPVPQPPPTPADELERCRRILAAADWLADLSMRLEQLARPPPASDIQEWAPVAAGRSW
jgi:hypothetical protein